MNKKFNTQFATQKLRQETSATNFGGATFTPGTGEQMATNKAFKKKEKKEVKDVEPKYAAGKAKIYMKDKWGWKMAPSIPNRPSKGGFIYKQLFEELSEFVKENEPVEEVFSKADYEKAKVILSKLKDTNSKLYNAIIAFASDVYPHDLDQELGADIQAAGLNEGYEHIRYLVADLKNLYHSSNDETFKKAVVDVIPDSDKYTYVMDMPEKYIQKLQNLEKMIPQARLSDPKRASEIINNAIEFFMDKQALNEGYAQFRNETKTRNKPDQFHQAVRAVKKKVQEINRLFEYVSRLKEELSEGQDGLKYKMHTEKALAKIKDMVNELNKNIKKFK